MRIAPTLSEIAEILSLIKYKIISEMKTAKTVGKTISGVKKFLK
jgi:hypothetical protein